MSRNVLLIGGTGFIGSALAEQFLNQGDEVTLFHRKMRKNSLERKNLRHILGDRNHPSIELRNGNYDVVVDLCGFRPNDFLILDYLDPKHYIFVSSVAVYSNFIAPLSDENGAKVDQDLRHTPIAFDQLNRHDSYSLSKLESEKQVRLKTQNCSVVRPSIVLGKNENTGRLKSLYGLPRKNARIPISPVQRFQFIDISDLVVLIYSVANMPPGENYNLVGPSLTWQDFVSTVIKVFEIENFLPTSYEAEFPFWDNYFNSGIRSLVSKHSIINQFTFTSLYDSLLMYKLDIQSS